MPAPLITVRYGGADLKMRVADGVTNDDIVQAVARFWDLESPCDGAEWTWYEPCGTVKVFASTVAHVKEDTSFVLVVQGKKDKEVETRKVRQGRTQKFQLGDDGEPLVDPETGEKVPHPDSRKGKRKHEQLSSDDNAIPRDIAAKYGLKHPGTGESKICKI